MADDKKQKTLFLDESEVAPPPPSKPASAQSTVMLDAPTAEPQRQVVVPTMMKQAPRQTLPPMHEPRRPSSLGRWIAGPLLAAVVAAGTVAVAAKVLPRPRKGDAVATGKPQGRVRISTEPPGASILVDGKRFPRFTPAVVEGDIGGTLKLAFSMDGYAPKEVEVYVTEGEHPFKVKLDATVRAPAPPATPTSEPAPAPTKKERHSRSPKEPQGTATISILVRPWAIVFVDKQRLKQTPVQGYELPSGKHVIELVNEGKNKHERIEITLRPDEAQEIKRDWDK